MFNFCIEIFFTQLYGDPYILYRRTEIRTVRIPYIGTEFRTSTGGQKNFWFLWAEKMLFLWAENGTKIEENVLV